MSKRVDPGPAIARAGCKVMGVLNVTPDSFSDGGRFVDVDSAVRRGIEMAAQGAHVIDVGGESTRPGATRVPAELELKRVEPVVRRLAEAGLRVSVDTTRAAVAEAVVEAGAVMVNDVSGGLADPAMPALVARLGLPYVVMHWRGTSEHMQRRAIYAHVIADVADELAARVEALAAEGVNRQQIILDPGIGIREAPPSQLGSS